MAEAVDDGRDRDGEEHGETVTGSRGAEWAGVVKKAEDGREAAKGAAAVGGEETETADGRRGVQGSGGRCGGKCD